MNTAANNKKFLNGPGEMKELTRNHDWEQSSLGPVERWPQTLIATLGIILNSKFPMFLFWGPEHICFYNDAYRPSLGNSGKHPHALGKKGADVWPEIWEYIKPIIDRVLSGGEASWEEDTLLPIYRNGQMENVYWTFSYSPVFDENGDPHSVFVTCVETTTKVVTGKQLAESKHQLQLAIDATDLATWDIDLLAQTFTGNTRLKKWHGWQPDDAFSLQSGIDRVVESDRQGLKAAVEKACEFASGGLLDHVYNIFNPLNKRLRTVRALGKASFNEDKIAHRLNGTLQDITIQQETFSKLNESIDKLRIFEKVVASTMDGVVITETDSDDKRVHRIIYVNNAFCNMTGYERDDVIGRSPSLMQGAKTDAVQLGKISEALLKGVPVKAELINYKKDGTEFYVQFDIAPVTNDAGLITHWVSVHRDMTEHFYATQLIQENEKRFRMLADSMPQLVWVADSDGSINFYNNRVSEFSGASKNKDGRWHWKSMLHPDDFEATTKAWEYSLRSGEPYVSEQRIKLANGQYRWFLSRALPQKDAENSIIRWYGTATEIHEQKAISDQLEILVKERTHALSVSTASLEEKNLQLEKMNKELQSFAYISSHDLQEPLRKIQTFANRIYQDEFKNLTDDGQSQFVRMQKAAQRMQTLIDDLLAYSRAGMQEKKFEITDIHEVFETVAEDLREEIQQRNAKLHLAGSCRVNIIPFQFRQLLHNLISNSLKFSVPEIAVVIKVECAVEEINGKSNCHISISDNGIGFEQEYSEKIFELFQRLHGRMDYEGTGIGLAIVKKIVENHHGSISSTSHPGNGARFDIYFPVAL